MNCRLGDELPKAAKTEEAIIVTNRMSLPTPEAAAAPHWMRWPRVVQISGYINMSSACIPFLAFGL
jgi:hypothetical protein